MLGEGLDQHRATWGLAALGFLNCAESGARNRNRSNVELLRVLVNERVTIFLYQSKAAVNEYGHWLSNRLKGEYDPAEQLVSSSRLTLLIVKN